MLGKSVSGSHLMAWHDIMATPKQRRELTRHGRKYEVLHTGGFVRFCTPRCRAYWLSQNELMHESADWKLHFSVELDQIPVAWNYIVRLFLDSVGEFGLKATTAWEDGQEWPEEQRGRELTVYIFRYDARYRRGPMVDAKGLTPKERRPFLFDKSYEQSRRYWWAFIRKAEASLSARGVQSRGCANGDLPVGSNGYASLRNEAYVPWDVKKDWNHQTSRMPMYPPNEAGWNAAGHSCPLAPLPRWICRLPEFQLGKDCKTLHSFTWPRLGNYSCSSGPHTGLLLAIMLLMTTLVVHQWW